MTIFLTYNLLLDPGCVQKCKEADFPCYDYTYEDPKAPTFEQVSPLLFNLFVIYIEGCRYQIETYCPRSG